MIREDFAAAGGCSTGLKMAGIEGETVGIEWEADAVATARAAGHQRIHADVRSEEVRGRKWGQLEGYSAGPPCQTFSTTGNGAGRRALEHLVEAAELVARGALPEKAIAQVQNDQLDERSVLVLEPLLVIARHRPRWIILEQVPAVLPIWKAFAGIMAERWGYSVETDTLSVEQFGVPQTRRRAILAARLDGKAHLPKPTNSRFHSQEPARLDAGVCKWNSMGEALDAAGIGVPDDWYVRSNYGTGGDAQRRGVRTANQPAFTVTGKVGRNQWRSKESGQVMRKMTMQEAAVFQTMPADYPWQGSTTSQYQQVGNAAPAKLIEAVARNLVIASSFDPAV